MLSIIMARHCPLRDHLQTSGVQDLVSALDTDKNC